MAGLVFMSPSQQLFQFRVNVVMYGLRQCDTLALFGLHRIRYHLPMAFGNRRVLLSVQPVHEQRDTTTQFNFDVSAMGADSPLCNGRVRLCTFPLTLACFKKGWQVG